MAKYPSGTTPAEAQAWLAARGVARQIINGLLPVLIRMWRSALEAGVQAGSESAGVQAQVSNQEYQDLLNQLAHRWVAQIATATLVILAQALTGLTVLSIAALVAAMAAALGSPGRAKQIAMTEVTRAMALIAQRIYHSAGIIRVRWVTEHDARVCALCDANEAAGPWPLGVPFPSGAPFPPQHPGCRCAIVPA